MSFSQDFRARQVEQRQEALARIVARAIVAGLGAIIVGGLIMYVVVPDGDGMTAPPDRVARRALKS